MERERLTWDDMVKKYPDLWVVLDDIEWLDEDESEIVSAVIVDVKDDDSITETMLRYYDEGHHYIDRRTTMGFGSLGVIRCENARIEIV